MGSAMWLVMVGVSAVRPGTAALRMNAGVPAGPVLTPRKDGIRRTLSTTGSPVPVGGGPPPDSLGWFDGEALGSCVVKRFTDEMAGERWMMWYSGRSGQIEADAPTSYGLGGSGCVGHAISKDGLVWERLAGDEVGGSCLGPNEESWWCFDTKHVSVGDVNVLSSKVVQNNMGLYVLTLTLTITLTLTLTLTLTGTGCTSSAATPTRRRAAAAWARR